MMSEELFENSATVEPADEVWQAWVAKNREADRLLNTRVAWIAISAVVALAVFAPVWLLLLGRLQQ
jgi:hypothetical protein